MMILKADIEGTWIEMEQPLPHYGKRLPTNTAWLVADPEELRQAAHELVSGVTVRLSDNEILIHYCPGLELLDLGSLRELLHLEGPLAVWRTARVALDLCQCLHALHAMDMPQMIIHPERIGQLNDRLVLIPTLPGILPLLPSALSNNAAGWFHYVAPEVLRTRGLDRKLLFLADIYSLGRSLEAMCMTSARSVDARDVFALATRRVETTHSDRLGDLSPALWRLGTLITRMCALLPDHRPALDEIIAELEALAQQHSPQEMFAGMSKSSRLADAEAVLEDLKQAHEERIFHVLPRTLHLLKADALMMRNPPDCGRAVMELEAAEAPDSYEEDVQIRMARVYARFKGLSSHTILSAEAYLRAAHLQNWPPDLVEEWMTILTQLMDPQTVLDLTNSVPMHQCPAKLVRLRIQCLQRVEQDPLTWWHEVTSCMAGRAFDPDLFALAQEVATHNDPTELVKWMHRHRGSKGHEAAFAVVWERNGNAEEAANCLIKVRDHTPTDLES